MKQAVMHKILPKYEGHFTSFCNCPCTSATNTLHKPQSRPKMAKHSILVLFFPFPALIMKLISSESISQLNRSLGTGRPEPTTILPKHHQGFFTSQHLFSATQTHQCLCSSTRHWDMQKKKAIKKKSKPGIALNFFSAQSLLKASRDSAPTCCATYSPWSCSSLLPFAESCCWWRWLKAGPFKSFVVFAQVEYSSY